MNWEIKIEKVDNGYILAHRDGNEDKDIRMVLEEPLEEGYQLIAMKDLLCYIRNYFGVYDSDKKRLEIKITNNKLKNRKHYRPD